MLTTGVDTLVGDDKGDVFNATYNGAAPLTDGSTLTVLDSIDGGLGNDTLNILATAVLNTTSIAGLEVKNVETVTIKGSNTVTADTTTWTGTNTLNVTKATAATLTAAATTDVNVSGVTGQTTTTGGNNVTVTQDMNATAGSGVQVNTANNVTITATDSVAVALGINVGAAAATAATGTVTINATGAAVVGNDGAVALDEIKVFGGTSVNITQVAAASYGDSASKNAGGDDIITQGAVVVNTTNNTTDVTITQDVARSAVDAANTTGAVTETASVKFGALKTGDKLTIESTSNDTINTGEFTLTAVKDMSATEVAAAFANLINGSAYGSLIAAGDTQSGAAFTKGTYTGLDTLWTSAAASGDTVVFTSNTANNTVADIDFFLTNTSTNSVAPIVTTTAGKPHDATMAGGVTGIVAGAVTIAAGTTATALTEVTVNSYGAGSAITGTAAALATINLSNGGAFMVSDTADTVTLTLEKVTGLTTFTAEPKTLNVKSIGDNIGVVAAANTTAFNVSGTGTLTQSGSLVAVKNITVTETAGLNLTSATLTALESIDATATTGAVTASILGAKTTYAGSKGVDTVTVTDADTAIAKAIDLGAGDDKLILSEAGAVKVPTVELKGGEGTDTLSIDAASAVTLSGATAFAAKLNSFERLEITGATGTQSVDVKKLGFANYVTVAGVTNGGTDVLTLNNLANNATVVINAAVADGVTAVIEGSTAGEADVLNVEITNDATTAFGTLNADKIETVNLTATDVFVDSSTPKDGKDNNDATHTMTFTSDTTTALNVAGTAGLTLTLTNASKLVTIDASKMTEGGLTVAANGTNAMTITGGAGNDVLTASATKADILVGGAGNDTLYAGANGASLTGGTGNDLFVLAATGDLTGNKEANTYSSIKDFQAGDLLQLTFNNDSGAAVHGVVDGALGAVGSFTKIAAALNPATSSYSDYVNQAILEAGVGEAVWFKFGNNSYVVIDSDKNSSTFTTNEDLVIELVGVDLTNASFNANYGTIAL